jgi:hypothetical protein
MRYFERYFVTVRARAIHSSLSSVCVFNIANIVGGGEDYTRDAKYLH